jgi:hypothetical protein
MRGIDRPSEFSICNRDYASVARAAPRSSPPQRTRGPTGAVRLTFAGSGVPLSSRKYLPRTEEGTPAVPTPFCGPR